MVSHSSHTNHEFLILVIRVTNVSFAIQRFVTYKKFSTSKILVGFFFFLSFFFFLFFFLTLLSRIYCTLSLRSSAKIRLGKCDQNPQKRR